MSHGKWIAGLRADMPLGEAAPRVLKVRLRLVRKHLPKAMREADEDPEHVHQLRVSTRRAAAALRIFAGSLRRTFHKRTRKLLRRLRRAGGDARDWDVFQHDLSVHLEKAPPSQQPGLQFLLGYAVTRRQEAQARLAKKGRPLARALAARVAEIPDAVKAGKKDIRLTDLARPLLSDLLAELDRAAQDDLTRYENLHQVRIAGKRLRYALEVFASCFGPELKDKWYPAVERLQDILGEANDSHTASQRLEALRVELRKQPAIWRSCRAGIEALLRHHQRRLPQLRRAFLQWWRQWRQSAAQQVLGALSSK